MRHSCFPLAKNYSKNTSVLLIILSFRSENNMENPKILQQHEEETFKEKKFMNARRSKLEEGTLRVRGFLNRTLILPSHEGVIWLTVSSKCCIPEKQSESLSAMAREQRQQRQGGVSNDYDCAPQKAEEVDPVMLTRDGFQDAFSSDVLGKSIDLQRQQSRLSATNSCFSAKPSVDPAVHEENERMWRAMVSDDDDDITDYIVSMTASAENYSHHHPSNWLKNLIMEVVDGNPRWCCGTYVYMNADWSRKPVKKVDSVFSE